MDPDDLRARIEALTHDPGAVRGEAGRAVDEVIEALDVGELRVAEPDGDEWKTHAWIKAAILLYFRRRDVVAVGGAYDSAPAALERAPSFYDKLPTKRNYARFGARCVPPGVARYGSFLGRNAILMPGFINIGAYVDEGTMVDTWATVGSCAQIGRNVHLSGGVGVGGVLEPLQAAPTIIEDDCFIGARSEIVEGVVIGAGSVISMGVFIGQSTRIYERDSGKIHHGYVPPGSVVVSGSMPSKDGSHSLYCAVIVKRVDQQTRAKTSLNELLRATD